MLHYLYKQYQDMRKRLRKVALGKGLQKEDLLEKQHQSKLRLVDVLEGYISKIKIITFVYGLDI